MLAMGMNIFCLVPKPNRSPVITINGCKQVSSNEAALMQAVVAQPVVMAIYANSMAFQRYGEGVFVGPCGTNLNHEMMVVVYGITDEHESKEPISYWIVKTSLGQIGVKNRLQRHGARR